MEEDDADGGDDSDIQESSASGLLDKEIFGNVGCIESNDVFQKPEKRALESEGSCEESFVTVSRKKSKRDLRSEVHNNGSSENDVSNDESYEVSLFCLQLLPKQMALARFLRDENIKNVIKIKYKSPYKVFITFNNKQQAEKLVTSKSLNEKDIRAQFTTHNTVSYGIVKDVDLEMSSEELIDNMTCSYEIISVKRLRRVDDDGKWSESKTVRLCFKSSEVPPFIYVFGCRFKVLRNEFPVTQCSRCWKFGHIKKYCNLNKNICPKCGGNHDNCETDKFKCPNCKGPHMALHKICPNFKKEKELRTIMSLNNTTYKKSLEIYLNNQKESEKSRNEEALLIKDRPSANVDYSSEYPLCVPSKTYSSVVKTTAIVHHNNNDCNEKVDLDEEAGFDRNINKKKKDGKKRSSKNRRSKELNQSDPDVMSLGSDVSEEEISLNKEKVKKRKIDWWKLLMKIKEIVLSEDSIGEKMVSVLKVIVSEFRNVVLSFLGGEDFGENFFNFFHGYKL